MSSQAALDGRLRLSLGDNRLREPALERALFASQVVALARKGSARPDLRGALEARRDPRIKVTTPDPDPRIREVVTGPDARIRRSAEEKATPLLVACGGTTLTLSSAYLASHSSLGMNAHIGVPLDYPTDQGWVFAGYALPLMDHPDNEVYWRGHSPGWTPPLNHHVKTTTTSTVYLRACGTWRMYFPADDVYMDRGGNRSQFPPKQPSDPSYFSFPTADAWDASGRFQKDYIAYTDSPDGGLHFPILGPRRSVWSGEWSWSDAGWRTTAVPMGPMLSSYKGQAVWVRYYDATVLDLTEETGYYVMVCLASLAKSNISARDACRTSSCDGCSVTYTDLNGVTTTFTPPHTLVVAFFSRSPDFAAHEIWPNPSRFEEAAILLAPEQRASKPTTGAPDGWTFCPIEWYGVPSTALSPTTDNEDPLVLLYLMWNGRSDHLPSRIGQKYPCDGIYRATTDVECTPMFYGRATANGISGFEIDRRLFEYVGRLLDAATERKGTSDEAVFQDTARTMLAAIDLYYAGEVIVSDGSRHRSLHPPSPCTDGQYPKGAAVCIDVPDLDPNVTDPQPLAMDGRIILYNDAPVLSLSTPSNDMTRVLYSTSTGSIDPTEPGVDFTTALARNSLYTVFQSALANYKEQFDARALFDWPPLAKSYGRLTSDVDPAYLGQVGVRLSFSGGVSTDAAFSDGLLYAIKSNQSR